MAVKIAVNGGHAGTKKGPNWGHVTGVAFVSELRPGIRRALGLEHGAPEIAFLSFSSSPLELVFRWILSLLRVWNKAYQLSPSLEDLALTAKSRHSRIRALMAELKKRG